MGLLSLFPPLATDMYLAALGELAASMNATHTAAELSLSIFFLGLCFGQVLIGPLADTDLGDTIAATNRPRAASPSDGCLATQT